MGGKHRIKKETVNLLELFLSLALFIIGGVGVSATDDRRLEFASKFRCRAQQPHIYKVDQAKVLEKVILNRGS